MNKICWTNSTPPCIHLWHTPINDQNRDDIASWGCISAVSIDTHNATRAPPSQNVKGTIPSFRWIGDLSTRVTSIDVSTQLRSWVIRLRFRWDLNPRADCEKYSSADRKRHPVSEQIFHKHGPSNYIWHWSSTRANWRPAVENHFPMHF